jgi:hypothetical protein
VQFFQRWRLIFAANLSRLPIFLTLSCCIFRGDCHYLCPWAVSNRKRLVFPSGDRLTFGLTMFPWFIQKKWWLSAEFADGGRLQRSGRL